MNREEAIEIIRKEYLCVDRDCDIERSCGKCDLMMPSKEPILEAYKMALKALEQMPVTTTAGEGGVIYYPQVEGVTPTVIKQEPCEDAISRQDVLDLAKKGVLISNGNYESVCKAINEIPSVNPIEPCKDAIDRAEAIRIASGYCHPANVAKELAKLPPVNLQPCEDTISRQAAIKAAMQDANDKRTNGFIAGATRAANRIKLLPPVKHQETVTEFADRCRECGKMRKGHWIYKQYGGYPEQGNYHCSECDKIDNNIPLYCPNCGAKMVEPQESEE